MKPLDFLKPISRLTYFYGFVFITLAPQFFGFSVASFFISLFFGIVKIIWDYRRIMDISSEKLYLLLLVIPFVNIIVPALLSKGGSVSLKYSVSELQMSHPLWFMMIGILAMISFIYQLFLFFMKGESRDVAASS